MKNPNWIANVSKLLMTVAIGMTSLGKYTFPKMPALLTKVLDVLVRQVAKYDQVQVPAR